MRLAVAAFSTVLLWSAPLRVGAAPAPEPAPAKASPEKQQEDPGSKPVPAKDVPAPLPRFTPSEKIEADSSVVFPVDI